MNRAQKMLSVLADRRPHTREEIQQRVGFFLTNNAASELRALGYEIDQRREKDGYVYQLVGAASGAAASSIPSVSTTSDGSSSAGWGGETATRDAHTEREPHSRSEAAALTEESPLSPTFEVASRQGSSAPTVPTLLVTASGPASASPIVDGGGSGVLGVAESIQARGEGNEPHPPSTLSSFDGCQLAFEDVAA